MADNEHDYDLFWHALNYRGASTENAEYFWKQLESCVARLIARDRRLWSDEGIDDEMGEKKCS